MNTINVNQAASQQLFSILYKASLENLNAGDILQGRVQSLDNGMLLIKLLDGSSFSASVPEGFTASQGELLTLEIGERQNNQLTAKIVPANTSQNTAGTMESQSIEQPSIAAQIGYKLAAYGIPPSEKLVAGVLELIKAEPGITMDQASFAVANQMDNNPEMLKVLQKISENEFQLHENLQSLKEGLANALAETNSSIKYPILKPLLVSQGLEELSQTLKQMLGRAPELKESILQNVRELFTKTLLDETTGNRGKLDMRPAGDIIAREIKADGFAMQPGEMNKLMEAVQKTLEDIHTKTDSLIKGETKEVEALLEKLFDKAVIKAEGGTLEDMDIKEKAKALKDIMDFSQKALNQMDAKTVNANLNALKELDGAFRFFSQVTAYDALIQLPIKINRENTTGELYVLKRNKGKKKVDADNFTLFLSLQTSSLGRIESFLNATRKCVTISFRVEQEDLVKLVKDNHRVLYDSLLQKGYKLAEMKCRVLENDRTGLCDAPSKTMEFLGLQASLDLKI